MKKVNDIPNFLSQIQEQNPPPPLRSSIKRPKENFLQKLVEASLTLQDTDMRQSEVSRDNSGDVFPPLVLVNTNTLLTPDNLPASTVRPRMPEFLPSKSEDDLQFLPISNPENSSKTKAIFPQNEKGDDEIVFITEKPQVNELKDFGFHQIQSPSLVERPEIQQAHIVKSELAVEGPDHRPDQRPDHRPAFSSPIPPERQRAEEQLEQLEELGR